MAETSGLVQRITVLTPTTTCVWVGPTPANTTALVVTNDGSTAQAQFATSLIQTLAAASTNYRPVVAVHGNTNSTITSVRIEPV